jgi:hypothetical protein
VSNTPRTDAADDKTMTFSVRHQRVRALCCELEQEVAALRETLWENREKWSWQTLLLVGRRLLEEVYPADIFTGASGDLGPTYIVALRNALAAMDELEKKL